MLWLAGCGQPEAAGLPQELDLGGVRLAPESELLDRGREALAVGDLAPDFRFRFADGATGQLRELRGQPVVINFWATWCTPCVDELPAFEQVYQEAEGRLAILAVNRNELPAAIARFAPSVDVSFPLIADPVGVIGDRYMVQSLPTTYFITSDGHIHARHVGALNAEQLREQLEELMGATPPR